MGWLQIDGSTALRWVTGLAFVFTLLLQQLIAGGIDGKGGQRGAEAAIRGEYARHDKAAEAAYAHMFASVRRSPQRFRSRFKRALRSCVLSSSGPLIRPRTLEVLNHYDIRANPALLDFFSLWGARAVEHMVRTNSTGNLMKAMEDAGMRRSIGRFSRRYGNRKSPQMLAMDIRQVLHLGGLDYLPCVGDRMRRRA